MILFIFAVLIFGSLALMGVVIRDIGKDISGMDESSKTTEERKNEKLRKEIERWREDR